MKSVASSGVVGGAKSRVASGRVQSWKCERPAASTKRLMYFSGMIIVRCGNFHEGLIERSDLVAVVDGFQ